MIGSLSFSRIRQNVYERERGTVRGTGTETRTVILVAIGGDVYTSTDCNKYTPAPLQPSSC